MYFELFFWASEQRQCRMFGHRDGSTELKADLPRRFWSQAKYVRSSEEESAFSFEMVLCEERKVIMNIILLAHSTRQVRFLDQQKAG